VPVDFDGDGITDVAIVGNMAASVRGRGGYKYSSDNTVLTLITASLQVDGLQRGDFDGDGRTDIAVWTGRGIASRPNGYWITFSSTNQVKFIPFTAVDGDRKRTRGL
jgi:hypothetical protein